VAAPVFGALWLAARVVAAITALAAATMALTGWL
jgi:hypothetical protein